MGLKEFYYSMEDKWYGLLDKIDKKIPVYKVIDKIDKLIPSFILFLIIVAIIIIALAFILIGSIAPEMTTVTLKVMDEEGITLSGIEALISWDGNELSETSNDNGFIQAEVPLGKELTVLIEEARYEKYEKTFIVREREQAFNVVLTRKEIPAQEITVEFTSNGALITGKEIKLKVSCSPYIPLEKTTYFDDDKDGRITVVKPGECDVMEGTATIDGYKSKKKILNDAYEVFNLEEEGEPVYPSEEEGKIQVEVEDIAGGILDDILVTLYDDYDVYLDSDYTINGTVIFDYLEPGYYSIVVEDELDGRYGTEREGNLRVYSEETTYVTVQLEKESYTIIARVLDLSSEERIPDATVELKDGEGNTIGSRDTGEDGEDVNFSISDEVPAFIYARAEGYLPNEIDLNADTREVDIYLEVMTPENSGRIHVNVVDEDDKTVENARVLIMDAETDFRANYPAKFSDSDGNVNYAGVKEGTYYILAQKGRAEGRSGEKTIDIAEVNEFLVQVEFGDTTLNIEIVDEDGKAIVGPGSEAEVMNASDGELLGTVVLVPEGKGEITLRSDKTVYVVAYAEGFEQTQTTPIELIRDETIDVQIMLRRPLVIENPVIEMTIFDEEKKEVGTNVPLEKGKEYTAKLKLRIPQNQGVHRSGIHFRVGTSPAMENDDLYLKDIIASNAMIIKGTTWNKDSYEEDRSYIVDAAEKGKWVNIEWQNAEPGTYEAKIKFFVKLDAEDEALAGIYYNGWFATKSGNQYRDPEDFESTHIMYANVHSPEYYIELIPEIEKVIKMTEEKILNLNETYEVYEEEPYLLQNNGKFRYDFTITNMSDEVYDDLLLSIRNYDNGKLQEDIEFSNYTISADITKSGNANNANEILNIATGRFRSFKTIEGEIDFTTKEEGKTLIQIKLLDRKTHTYIFTSELEFEVVADGEIILKEEKILNLNEEISVYEIEPYNLSVHGDYQYEFTLKNMSNKSYNNPALTLMNSDNGSVLKEDIGFGEYRLSDGVNVSGNVHNENEIENIGIGDFSRNDMVKGEAEFKTEKEETTTSIFMKLTDKDSKEVVFTHKTSFRIISDNTFLIDFEPDPIPAYKETSLEVAIRDEKKKEAIEGARVTVKIQEIGKRARGIRTKETPENGRLNFFIPSLSPEHVIWIEAKKTGFITKKIYTTLDGLELDIPEECLEVDEACIRDENVQLEDVIGVEPKRINSDLKVGDKEEEIFGLIFSNKIGIDFYISDLTIVPEFTWNGLVKNVQMQNWLNQWVQGKGRRTVIPGYGPNNDSSLKTVINSSMVRSQEVVEGTLIIRVRNDEHDREYAYSIPVEIGVSPGGFVEVDNCLIVSGAEVPEWIASAEPGQASIIHFNLTNNCKVGDRYVELENVQAKLNWISNQTGSFDLALNGGSVSLKGNSWVIALDRMAPEEVLDGYLTFTPLGLTKAQLNAEAMIHFNGEVLARGGEGAAVMMKVNTENANNTFIHADLKILNLRKCIKTNPKEIVSFDENSFEEELTIENKCDIPLKIRLCSDEDVWGCGMDSDVLQFEGFQFKQAERNFPEFELDAEDERTLTIKRKEYLPLGAYSIKIEARQVEDNEFYYREVARPRVEILGQLYMEKLFLAIDKEGGKYLAEQDVLHNKGEVGPDGYGAYVDPMWWMETGGHDYKGQTYEEDCNKLHKEPYKALFGENREIKINLPIDEDKLLLASDFENVLIGIGSGAAVGFYWGGPVGAIIGAVIGGVLGGFWNTLFPATVGPYVSHIYHPWYLYCGYVVDYDHVRLPYEEPTVEVDIVSNKQNLAIKAYELSGDRYYYAEQSWMHIWGQGNEDHDLDWDITCPRGYVIVPETVKGEELPGADDCDYHGPDVYETSVHFNGGCNGSRFHDFGIDIKGQAVCKLKKWDETGRVPLKFEVTENRMKTQLNAGLPVYTTFNVYADKRIEELNSGGTTLPVGDIRVEFSIPKELALPDVDLNTFDCTGAGFKDGRTGEGALPKINLAQGKGWLWEDVPVNACDQDNPEHVFCDATQFSIELMQRIQVLDAFLNENGYVFECPENELEEELSDGRYYSTTTSTEGLEEGVDSGEIGISDVVISTGTLDEGSKNTHVIVQVQNRTDEEKSAEIDVTITNDEEGYSETCKKDFAAGIPAAGGESGGAGIDAETCDFYDLEPSDTEYEAKINLTSTGTVDPEEVTVEFVVIQTEPTTFEGCHIPAGTAELGGVFIPEYWLDKDGPYGDLVRQEDFETTNEVRDLEDLYNLTHFNAFLMQDSYTADFQKDFHDAMTKTNFFDAPNYYRNTTDGFGKYFSDPNRFAFSVEDSDSTRLPAPGLYRVDIDVWFSEDWKFFDSGGDPIGVIIIRLNRLASRDEQMSAFYYLPFDGRVGLEGSTYNRQGYGVAYSNYAMNLLQGEEISEVVKTYSSAESNPFMEMDVEFEQDFRNLNSELASRGDVLKISGAGTGQKKMVFSPSIGTPVMLKVENPEGIPIKAFYRLMEEGRIGEAGSTLGYWDGADKLECKDFDGTFLWNKYSVTDSKASSLDLREGVNIKDYKLEWDNVNYQGNVWYKSMFYTPTEELYALHAVSPASKMTFYSPSVPLGGGSVTLNGTMGLSGTEYFDEMNSLNKIFDLVREGKMCIADNGRTVDIFWNEKALYEDDSTGNSLADIEEGINSGSSEWACITG